MPNTITAAIRECSSDRDLDVSAECRAVYSGSRIFLTDMRTDEILRTSALSELREYAIVGVPGLWAAARENLQLQEYHGSWYNLIVDVRFRGLCFRSLRRHGLDLAVVVTALDYWQVLTNGISMTSDEIEACCKPKTDILKELRESNARSEFVNYTECEIRLLYAWDLQKYAAF